MIFKKIPQSCSLCWGPSQLRVNQETGETTGAHGLAYSFALGDCVYSRSGMLLYTMRSKGIFDPVEWRLRIYERVLKEDKRIYGYGGPPGWNTFFILVQVLGPWIVLRLHGFQPLPDYGKEVAAGALEPLELLNYLDAVYASQEHLPPHK